MGPLYGYGLMQALYDAICLFGGGGGSGSKEAVVERRTSAIASFKASCSKRRSFI